MSEKGKEETEAVLKEKIEQIKSQVGQDMEIKLDDAPFAPKFQEWIDDYEHDVGLFKDILQDETAPPALRRLVAGGLMYLIRTIDLIPDYIKPIGLIDDSIVMRVTADLAAEFTAELDPKFMKAMFKLANDAETLREFLGDDYRNLENYVRLQPEQPAHGITGDSVVEHAEVRKELLVQVEDEMRSFEAKQIEDGAHCERELRSYLHAKLSQQK